MIKFFRKIRQRLLNSGQMKKYTLYAIGEIILVVIGILIAVQINNKNVESQRRDLERNVLKEIMGNLEDDMIQIIDELESDRVVINSDSILIHHFQAKLPFNDSIAGHLRIAEMYPHFDAKESGYQLLESKGIDLIANDSLRIEITNFYNRDYPYFRKYEKERVDIVQSIIKPYLVQNSYLEKYSEWPYVKRTPMNYHFILKDPQLISILQTSSNLASTMHQKGTFIKRKAENLQKEILKYLKE